MKKIEFVIAARSLFRNRRRMLVTVSTVVIAVFVCVLLRSLTVGFEDAIARQAIDQNVGAVQIHKRGYSERGSRSPLKYKFTADEDFLRRVSSIQGVKTVSPRIVFESQVSAGPHQAMLNVLAIEPHSELRVCPKSRRVEGLLAGGSETAMSLGEVLLKSLAVPENASGVLSATNSAGRQNAMDVTLGAPYRATNPLESKGVGVVSLAFAERLLGMPNEATEIAIAVQERHDIEATIRRLQESLGSEFEVRSWLEIEPTLTSIMDQQSRNMSLLMGILALLVTFGVSNTMILAVSERNREIGTLASIGVAPSTVTRLFVLEGLTIGTLGSCLGLLLGTLAVLALGSSGITMPSQPGTDPMIIVPRIDGAFSLLVVTVALFLAAAASFFPARQAAKMKPVQALASV